MKLHQIFFNGFIALSFGLQLTPAQAWMNAMELQPENEVAEACFLEGLVEFDDLYFGNGPSPIENVKEWLNVDPQSKWAIRNAKNSVDFTQLKGKVVVIEFWATWCPPCVKSAPHLNQLHKKYGDDLVIIALTSLDSRQNEDRIQQFIKTQAIEYPVGILDQKSTTPSTYGVRYIPYAVIFDQEQKQKWSGNPLTSGFDSTLSDLLD